MKYEPYLCICDQDAAITSITDATDQPEGG